MDLAGAVAALAPSLGGLSPSASRSWSVGPLASWALPNQTAARIRAARAVADADFTGFDGALLAALEDVEVALTLLAADLGRRDALTARVIATPAAVRLADDRYRAGRL